MARFDTLAAAVVALATATALFACKEREGTRPSETTTGSDSVRALSPVTTTQLGSSGPRLPSTMDAGPEPDAQTAAQSFDGESRDQTWASATERDIRRWITDVPRPFTVECRSAMCKLEFDGDESALAAAAARAESGLRGKAANIVLDLSSSDGRAPQLVVYAQFAR